MNDKLTFRSYDGAGHRSKSLAIAENDRVGAISRGVIEVTGGGQQCPKLYAISENIFFLNR